MKKQDISKYVNYENIQIQRVFVRYEWFAIGLHVTGKYLGKVNFQGQDWHKFRMAPTVFIYVEPVKMLDQELTGKTGMEIHIRASETHFSIDDGFISKIEFREIEPRLTSNSKVRSLSKGRSRHQKVEKGEVQ